MSDRRHFGPKPPPEQSDKDHTPLPPNESMPDDKSPEDSRGHAGQYTDRGAPGVQKR